MVDFLVSLAVIMTGLNLVLNVALNVKQRRLKAAITKPNSSPSPIVWVYVPVPIGDLDTLPSMPPLPLEDEDQEAPREEEEELFRRLVREKLLSLAIRTNVPGDEALKVLKEFSLD